MKPSGCSSIPRRQIPSGYGKAIVLDHEQYLRDSKARANHAARAEIVRRNARREAKNVGDFKMYYGEP